MKNRVWKKAQAVEGAHLQGREAMFSKARPGRHQFLTAVALLEQLAGHLNQLACKPCPAKILFPMLAEPLLSLFSLP